MPCMHDEKLLELQHNVTLRATSCLVLTVGACQSQNRKASLTGNYGILHHTYFAMQHDGDLMA